MHFFPFSLYLFCHQASYFFWSEILYIYLLMNFVYCLAHSKYDYCNRCINICMNPHPHPQKPKHLLSNWDQFQTIFQRYYHWAMLYPILVMRFEPGAVAWHYNHYAHRSTFQQCVCSINKNWQKYLLNFILLCRVELYYAIGHKMCRFVLPYYPTLSS